MLRKLYLSPFGWCISILLNTIALFKFKFIVYGYFSKSSGKFLKHTRIASTAILNDKINLDIADHVWIGHYCLLDGIGGISIGEGVNIASHSCIYSHGSHDSIRLLGKSFIETPAEKRIGYQLEKVSIGDYTFVGTSAVVLPGVSIGRGCIIGAGSVINVDIPDFSIAVGNPVKIVGDTRKRDEKYLNNEFVQKNYYQTKTKSNADE